MFLETAFEDRAFGGVQVFNHPVDVRVKPVSRARSWFYSDSHNDLPLMKLVEHPVAANPDPTLRAYAEEQGWPIISLR